MVSRPVESKIPGTCGAGVVRLPSFCRLPLAGKPKGVTVPQIVQGTPNALRRIRKARPGTVLTLFTGPDLEVAARRNPVAQKLCRVVNDLLAERVVVYRRSPAARPHPSHFSHHALVRKRRRRIGR